MNFIEFVVWLDEDGDYGWVDEEDLHLFDLDIYEIMAKYNSPLRTFVFLKKHDLYWQF